MNILIIGLRKKDIDRLKNKFKNLNLSFILSENITSKSFNNIEKFKYIISMTKFCSHLTEYKCNRHPGYIRLLPTQGISTINSILDSLI